MLDGEIVYIGKNDTYLIDRIYQHTLETKFRQCKEAKIYYAELGNSTESSVMEMLLINKYKPRLNVTFVQDNLTIDFQEPEWIKYDEKDFKHTFDYKAGLRDRLRSPGRDCIPAWLEDSMPVFSKPYENAVMKFVHGQCRICGAISDEIVGVDWVASYSPRPQNEKDREDFSYRKWTIREDTDALNGFYSDRGNGDRFREYGSDIHAISCCPSCYSSYLKPLVDGLMRVEKMKVPIRKEYEEATNEVSSNAKYAVEYVMGLFDKPLPQEK